jgi:Spy/CpxP family protein refolding chaperone
MMGRDRDMGRGMGGYGRGMGPDQQGWQGMTPEQRERWRQMRSQFMQDTLPLRQELNAKQMELETLWDQQNPNPEKVKALSDRITELRSKLDQKHDEYLTQCRREFGDRGWACPGGGWRRY